MLARSAVLAIVTIALCGCAAGSHLAADPMRDRRDPVPWISTTPNTLLLPTPSPTVIPDGTRPCQTTDLHAVFGSIVAMTGGQLAASILLGNRSASACVLAGTPGVQLFDRAGAQIPLTTTVALGRPSDPVLVQPGTGNVQARIPREGVAYVEVDWQTHDGAGNPCVPSPPEGAAIGVSLPGGRESLRVAVADPMSMFSTIAPCYSRLAVSAFQHWPAPEPSPTPDPLASLTIHVDTPSTVSRGAILHYTVTLENTGTEVVRFPTECPAYGEWGANSAQAFAKDFYVLNCRPVGSIAPGQSVRFAMQITVPSGTEPGQYTLSWQFVGILDLNKTQGTAVVTVAN